jgi:hypothetical protein
MALVRGQLAAVAVAGSGTLTDIYTVPTSKVADVNITIANRTDANTLLRVAIIKGALAASVAVEDYIMFDLPTTALASNLAPISINSTLMEAGDTVAVYSSAQAISVQVNGIEEDV